MSSAKWCCNIVSQRVLVQNGYTDINFAAFAMLGRRFSLMIRGLKKHRLYRVDARDYGTFGSLVGRADRKIDTRGIADQWDRLGHFYASLESGHTTASLAMRRLAGFSAKNGFYRANSDPGRILKTEFILQYMSEPALRMRIRRGGLLKVEQMHALARDLFYGNRSRINARDLWEQMNSCSCLTLIVACIIYLGHGHLSRHSHGRSGAPRNRALSVAPRQPDRVGRHRPVR